MVWAIGPEVAGGFQPFTNTITGIFSFFLRSGWSDVSETLVQNLTSISGINAASWGFYIALNGNILEIYSHDASAGLARHQVQLGDEDGVNWIQPDKWYQVGFSISASAFTYAINGSTTPYVNVVSAVNGDLNLDSGNDRWWWLGGRKANSTLQTFVGGEQALIEDGWPTFVVGAAAWSTTYIDWSDTTARGRVFDTDGNFKNPGENGSLWFDDDYDSVVPEFYFLDGSPRRDNGTYNASIPQSWGTASGGATGSVTAPGGLRKQYENQWPDDWWIYKTLAIAEASGDAWIDGDTIFIPPTSVQFLYKSVLAVSGHNGLIHKYPFGTPNGVLSAVVLKGSEAANSDPDTWVDLGVKTAVGTQGVDYELDTDGGLSRIRDLTDTGTVQMASTYQITAADTAAFRIMYDVDLTQPGGGAEGKYFKQNIRCYEDAANYFEGSLSTYGAPNAGNGRALSYKFSFVGGYVNGISNYKSDTPHRIWLYISTTRTALWIDDGAEETQPLNFAATSVVGASPIPIATTTVGAASGATRQTMHIGTDVFGSMTIS